MLKAALFAVMFTFTGGDLDPEEVLKPGSSNLFCGVVEECVVNGMDGDRMLYAPAAPRDPLPTWYHRECLICDWQDGIAGICHFTCSPAEQQQQDEDLLMSYVELIDAFESGNVSEIMRMARTEGWPVVWQANRGALQLMDCDGQGVVASLAVPHALEVALHR